MTATCGKRNVGSLIVEVLGGGGGVSTSRAEVFGVGFVRCE